MASNYRIVLVDYTEVATGPSIDINDGFTNIIGEYTNATGNNSIFVSRSSTSSVVDAATVTIVERAIDIYNQGYPEELPVIDAKCSLELNEPGSLEFTLAPTHPLIDAIEPYASYVKILDGSECIFYGRVITRSKNPVTGIAAFQCSGALSFLQDSEIFPYGKNAQGQPITKKDVKAKAFLQECIDCHNIEVQNDPRRRFQIGTINASKMNEEDDYSIQSYTETKSAIESNILNPYGGFLRVRNVNGNIYLDWIENYEALNPQAIQLTVNLQDQTNETDATSLFTVIRPIGANNMVLEGSFVTSSEVEIYPEEAIRKYGRIVKSIQFGTATTQSKLRSKANKYKNKLEKTLFESANIKWIDMQYLDGSVPKVSLGARFTNIVGYSGITMVVTAMEIDFNAPWNNTLDLKNKKSLDSDNTQQGHGHSTKGTLSKSHAKGQGQMFRYIREQGETLEIVADTVNMHGTTLNQYYQTINQHSQTINTLVGNYNRISGEVEELKERIGNTDATVQHINGTAVIQNSDTIWNLAGQFDVTNVDGATVVTLHHGSALAVDDENGVSMDVGTSVGEAWRNAGTALEHVNTIEGSALWTQRSQITGVCGEFEIVTRVEPDPNNPGHTITKRYLIVKNGGGFLIRRNNTEFGIYDEGNLTGGMMVKKINGQTAVKIKGDVLDIEAKWIKTRANEYLDSIVGHMKTRVVGPQLDGSGNQMYDPDTGRPLYRTELVFVPDAGMVVERNNATFGLFDEGNLTAGIIVDRINGGTVKIKGSRILIGDELSGDDLPEWAQGVTGTLMYKATIGSLNAVEARVGTLEADAITVNTLSASIAGLTSVGVQNLAASGAISFKSGNNYVAVADAICDLQVTPSGNQFILQKKTWSDVQYNRDWTNIGSFSRAVASLEGSGWDNGVFTVTVKPQNQIFTGTRLAYLAPVGDVTTNVKLVSRTFKVQYGDSPSNYQDTGFEQSVSISAVDVYNNGWAAARTGCLAPSSTNNTDSMTVKIPNATVDGDPVPYTYTPAVDKNNCYIKQGTTTVAVKSHSIYSNGWTAARNSCSVPASTSTGSSMTVNIPNSTVDGEPLSYPYSPDVDNDYCYIKQGTSTVVARKAHSIYSNGVTAGQNGVSISSHYGRTYNGGNAGTIVEVIAATSNNKSNTILLYLSTSSGKAYVRKDAWNGSVIGQIDVPIDHSSEVTISSHYGRTYNGGNAGTMVEVIATTSNSKSDTILLYLSTSGGKAYVRKDGWDGSVIGQIDVPIDHSSEVTISSHYGRTYNGGNAGTMVEVIAKASNNNSNTIYLYLSTSGGKAYVRKDAYNGSVVGQITVPPNTVPSSVTLLNGNKLVMYTANGTKWLNGASKYWYYSDTKYE